MTDLKVKSVVEHPSLFLPLPKVNVERRRFRSILLDLWLKRDPPDRAPKRSAAMVDVVGLNFVALIVDTVEHQLLFSIVAPRDRLWELYRGMLEPHQGRPPGTVIISAPFIGAEVRRQGGEDVHIDCESRQYMIEKMAFSKESLDGGSDGNDTPSQWPSSGPPGVAAGQSLLAAQGAVLRQDAPVVERMDGSGKTTSAAIVPPS